ncbi:hypothetical protein ACF1GS_29695 [Streptomyces eurythermus]|uniref:hypothetical protein n=1 Tax=Streptomyces eurythermus TaxID=42237 RepID=UPI0036F649FB
MITFRQVAVRRKPLTTRATDHPGRALAEQVDQLGLHVTSLINNAGFATFGPFHQADPDRLRREIAGPPPRHNFVSLPRIRSESPAFDLHHPEIAALDEAAR